MTTTLKNTCSTTDQVQSLIHDLTEKLEKCWRRHAFVHMCFWSVLAVEALLLLLIGTAATTTFYVALLVSLLFLTGFSYFLVRLHLQSTKPVELIEIGDEYDLASQELLNPEQEIFFIELAQAHAKFASHIQGMEYRLWSPIFRLQMLRPLYENMSHWWHWYDVYKMREILLLKAVDAYLSLIKLNPTELDYHASLANAYVMLSTLYQSKEGTSLSELMQKKFEKAAEQAIEEFKILNAYAPNDAWIHVQLAYSYRDLQMPNEEIKEYETLMRLRPRDSDILFRLGTLYFQQGKNVEGLRIYEQLKKFNPRRAAHLIRNYGAL